MTLHDIYDVLDGYEPVRIAKLVAGEEDDEIYCGDVYDFPYYLMRRYGSRNVLLISHENDVCLPQKSRPRNGISVLIEGDEQEEQA